MKFEKTSCCTLTIILVTVLGIIPLCYAEASSEKTSIEDIKNETRDLLTALKSYTSDQRDEAIQKTRSALKKLDKRIDT
jgi:hypothetical protein